LVRVADGDGVVDGAAGIAEQQTRYPEVVGKLGPIGKRRGFIAARY
jgi:hypothetical protein